jgi:hypothetical protein
MAAAALLAASLCVSGWLTQKGPDRESFWAITDAHGTVWRITNPRSVGLQRLARLQQLQVAANGRRAAAVPLAGLQVQSLRLGSCPGGAAGQPQQGG